MKLNRAAARCVYPCSVSASRAMFRSKSSVLPVEYRYHAAAPPNAAETTGPSTKAGKNFRRPKLSTSGMAFFDMCAAVRRSGGKSAVAGQLPHVRTKNTWHVRHVPWPRATTWPMADGGARGRCRALRGPA
eukprot:6886266-Prymnesium_polylepis.1